MIRDKGEAADSSMVLFTGSESSAGYVDVPEEVLNQNFPAQTFTLATWMRHKPIDDGTDKHRKEHIICKADDHRKNRHHMALFVRNCKLVLLLRREYIEGEENTFRPAEWRWKMPHVCDYEWHHYAVNVDFPEVELIVDGEKWSSESKIGHEGSGNHVQDNPEIIDDWPLHPAGDINTKVTIGACWQGSESSYRHQLRGYLAGLAYLPGSNENEDVLKCLHQCAESLQIPAVTNSMSSGMEMVIDSKGSVVKVDGKTAKDVASMVQRVAYLNTREFPVPGRRIARLETQLECENHKTIHLEDERVDVDVISVPEPTIRISGTDDISRDYEDFKLGVRIFADVHILMTTSSSSGGEPVNGIENRLDHCAVTVSPPLNPDHESIDVPEDLLRSLKITGTVSLLGAEFSGAEMIYNYERLLRQVTYTNKKPAYYLNRQFKIACSELNGRFISNEYVQTLTVIHPTINEAMNDIKEQDKASEKEQEAEKNQDRGMEKHVPSRVAHRQVNIHGVAQGGAPNVYNLDHEGYLLGLANRTHNNITAVIVVVCVAFVGVIVILGILRIRAAHKRTAREELQAEVEMAWDDSALNIVVNPLDDDLGGVDENGMGGKRIPSELAKSTSVVGLNSNGKMSRHTNPSMTTTTISSTGHLPANHNEEEQDDEEGYLSTSEEEDDDDDEYTDGDEDDDDVDCCDDDCDEEDEEDNDDHLDIENGDRILKNRGSEREQVAMRGEREIHSMEWDNNL